MIKIEKGTFPYYVFENLSACRGMSHFISSNAKNVGFCDKAPSEQIVANRSELAGNVGFDLRNLVVGHQVHGDMIAKIGCEEAGRGACDDDSRIPGTDALVTDQEGICLMVMTADCVPVLLFEPERRVVAAVHAGWRGTVAKIVAKTVDVMCNDYGCDHSKIVVGIGPSIGACCFEVGEEVAEKFRPDYADQVVKGRGIGKFHVDLGEVNRVQLLDAGVKAENIESSGLCTVCHHDKFFSYRCAGTSAGRFGSGIMLQASEK